MRTTIYYKASVDFIHNDLPEGIAKRLEQLAADVRKMPPTLRLSRPLVYVNSFGRLESLEVEGSQIHEPKEI